MTDHAELRRLAEAAEFGGGAHEDIEFSNQLDFHAACTPAAILALLDEIERLESEIDQCVSALPGTYYMDPPDGGNVSIPEQIRRMAKDAARYRWLIASAWYVGPEPSGDTEAVSWHDHNDTMHGVTTAIDAAQPGATSSP
ncbi:hypothetical protein ACTXY5_14570 [Pseudomonas aeruginosa]|uniref:hypothetical protein n=1 Tax=Pseudomonas aeruginosa TaxID=287 RepID=UPI003FD22D79